MECTTPRTVFKCKTVARTRTRSRDPAPGLGPRRIRKQSVRSGADNLPTSGVIASSPMMARAPALHRSNRPPGPREPAISGCPTSSRRRRRHVAARGAGQRPCLSMTFRTWSAASRPVRWKTSRQDPTYKEKTEPKAKVIGLFYPLPQCGRWLSSSPSSCCVRDPHCEDRFEASARPARFTQMVSQSKFVQPRASSSRDRGWRVLAFFTS